MSHAPIETGEAWRALIPRDQPSDPTPVMISVWPLLVIRIDGPVHRWISSLMDQFIVLQQGVMVVSVLCVGWVAGWHLEWAFFVPLSSSGFGAGPLGKCLFEDGWVGLGLARLGWVAEWEGWTC